VLPDLIRLLPQSSFSQDLGAAVVYLWTVAYIRRLHDLGRSGWWSLVSAVALLPYCLGFIFGGPGFVAKLLDHRPEETVIGNNWYFAALISGLLLQYAFVIWLGVQPGEVGDNRFGPQPANWNIFNRVVRRRRDPS
jgi:uncharacterized membrane protein YhaH (DUF805 family)